MTQETAGGNTYNLPSDRLRITATYEREQPDDTVPDGQPSTVEVIYNDAIGATPEEASAFICTVIAALNRGGYNVAAVVDNREEVPA